MKRIYWIAFLLISNIAVAQNNTQFEPYIETSATVDSLVVPDMIYLSIRLDEKDSKGKLSVEELENRMESALKDAGIDLKKQLSLGNLGSRFSKYFLRKKDVSKEKLYQLLVHDAKTLSEVLINLEKVKISNVRLRKVEYSKSEQLKLVLRKKAVVKAKIQANYLVEGIGQKVGKAIMINDANFPNRGYLNASFDDVALIGNATNYKRKDIGKIEFRKIELVASVKVRFHLY